MPSKYKYYSGFVAKYVGNILKLQTKEEGILPIAVGLMVVGMFGCWWVIEQVPSWAFVVFMLAGLAVMLRGFQIYFTTWTFDRFRGLAVYKRPGLPEKKFVLDKIIGVHLDSRTRRRFEEYRIVLEMANSEWVPLSRYGRLDPQIEAQLALCEFLGMEEDQLPAS